MEIRNLPKPTELKFHVDSVILEAILAAEKFFLSNVCFTNYAELDLEIFDNEFFKSQSNKDFNQEWHIHKILFFGKTK